MFCSFFCKSDCKFPNLVDSFAEVKEIGVVLLAILDGLVHRVEGLLGAVVRESFSVIGKKCLRGVAT
jgi:hypothetical protein